MSVLLETKVLSELIRKVRDPGDRPFAEHDRRDAQYSRLRRYRRRNRQPLDGGISGTTDGFARVKIVTLLEHVGWNWILAEGR